MAACTLPTLRDTSFRAGRAAVLDRPRQSPSEAEARGQASSSIRSGWWRTEASSLSRTWATPCHPNLSPNPNLDPDPEPNPEPNPNPGPEPDPKPNQVLMAQPCHHNICPSARAAKYNSTTCVEQRAVRLENVRQGLREGQWLQRHDGRVILRTNSSVPQVG